jgi:hypothetical protein
MCEALAPMLADRHILKVMHSASEDIVAFKRACGVAPTPLVRYADRRGHRRHRRGHGLPAHRAGPVAA